jgi:ubiquinone/menaquinone biosynthesis C-methylase UbiE
MKEVISFLSDQKYSSESVLEIRGKTKEWLSFFKRHTFAAFPEVDAHNLPYSDDSFDAVFCNQVLEHVSKPWVCVDEFHRVLKSGGILILSSPFIYQEHNHPVDNWRFTPSGLGVLCENFSEILLSHKGGNSKMVEHMIKNPSDRHSRRFRSLLAHEDENKIYYTISTIIAKK